LPSSRSNCQAGEKIIASFVTRTDRRRYSSKPGFAGLFFFSSDGSVAATLAACHNSLAPVVLRGASAVAAAIAAHLQKAATAIAANDPRCLFAVQQFASGVTLKKNREKLRLASHLST